MSLLHRSGVCALALMAGAATMQIEPAVVRNIIIDSSSGHVAIGAVKTSLWSAAFAQSADSFSLENVRFTFGSASYELPRINFSGVTSSRADIEALTASGSTERMASRLAKINAKRIEIPEVRLKQQLGKNTQTATYKNIVMEDLVQGRMASAVLETMAVESTGEKGTMLVSTGRSTMSDVDMGALASLYETKAEGDATLLWKIYGAFSIENMDVTSTVEGTAFKVARMSGRDFLARPTRDSWTGTGEILTELGQKEKLSPEESQRVIGLITDMLQAFQIGQLEASGIEIKDARKQADGKSPSMGRIERITYSGGASQQPADMRMEGLDVGDQDSRVKIGAISLTGFSIAPTLEGLKNLQGKKLDDLDQATLRTLIPTLGTLRVSGVDIDALSKGESDQTPERAKVTIESFEVTADKPLNGIPTNIRVEQRNASLALPSDSTDEFVQGLKALGYSTFGSSFLIAANWNEATGEITLNEVSAQGQDMGRVSLTGLIGNVSKDLFSTDEATAAAALFGLKAKAAHLVVEDKGLLGRYLTQTAKEAKIAPEALRKSYANAAPAVISSMLGNTDQVKALSQAVARFIAQPGKLTIDAQPKNPSGFGMMDVMLASQPKDAVSKLNISAKSE